MLRSLTENRRLPGPPYVIDESAVDYVMSFAHGIGARILRVEVPPGASRRETLKRLGRALDFPDHFGANWDAWSDCLGDFIEVAQGGTVVILERSERLLDTPPALFAEVVHQLQQSQDLVASAAGERLRLEFVFSGRWAGNRLEGTPAGPDDRT